MPISEQTLLAFSRLVDDVISAGLFTNRPQNDEEAVVQSMLAAGDLVARWAGGSLDLLTLIEEALVDLNMHSHASVVHQWIQAEKALPDDDPDDPWIDDEPLTVEGLDRWDEADACSALGLG